MTLKCARCGLVNFAADQTCRRCGASLLPGDLIAEEPPVETEKERGFGRRLLWVVGMTLTLLFVYFMSLLVTSEGLDVDERGRVADAVAVLKKAGFSKETFVLGNLVRYRSTDNWWNSYMGHLPPRSTIPRGRRSSSTSRIIFLAPAKKPRCRVYGSRSSASAGLPTNTARRRSGRTRKSGQRGVCPGCSNAELTGIQTACSRDGQERNP